MRISLYSLLFLSFFFTFIELLFDIFEPVSLWFWLIALVATVIAAYSLAHRNHVSKFGQYSVLAFYLDRNLETVLFGITVTLSFQSVFHVGSGLMPHFVPGLLIALSYLAVWRNSRRVVRHHLLAAIATALLITPLSLLSLGSARDHPDGLLAHPAMVVVFAVLALSAILDYLLLDLRNIANSEPVEPAGPLARDDPTIARRVASPLARDHPPAPRHLQQSAPALAGVRIHRVGWRELHHICSSWRRAGVRPAAV